MPIVLMLTCCQQDELYGLEGRPLGAVPSGKGPVAYSLRDPDTPCHYGQQWAFLEFDHPVIAPKVGEHFAKARVIASSGPSWSLTTPSVWPDQVALSNILGKVGLANNTVKG